MSQFKILLDTETIQFEQHCAIQSLMLLLELLDKEIIAVDQNGGRVSPGYLQTLADAIYSAAVSLLRSNENLKAAVEAECEKRKKGE